MDHIIVDFNMFDAEQKIMVYINGACVNMTKVPSDEVAEKVNALAQKYNIKTIDLWGSVDYVARFKAEIGTKFDNNEDVEINVISK